jgi:hypothetical protein
MSYNSLLSIEGRRKKEEGRRKREEGRGKKEEGRGKREERKVKFLYISLLVLVFLVSRSTNSAH